MTEDQRQSVILESANHISTELVKQAIEQFKEHLLSLNPDFFNRHDAWNLATTTGAMLAIKICQEVARITNLDCQQECTHDLMHPDNLIHSMMGQVGYFKNKLLFQPKKVVSEH